ncbi:MAG: hypothetical protein LBI72_01735 [Flavobacteriaceae bacterium]|jgi:hypothetical protein|nr:hypothetical protein [Flavobacteriaceae bacterium]
MKKVLFILFLLIRGNVSFAQDWSIDLSYNLRDTIFTYYIDSDPTLIFYKDVSRTRDTRQFSKIKITKEGANEILELIQCIRKEREKDFDFRGDVEVFVTITENDIVTEFSFAGNQTIQSWNRLLEWFEVAKEKKPIFVNFIYSDGPPSPP